MTQTFFGDEITIRYFAPLSAAEVAPLVDQLEPLFLTVRTERHPSPPWATPLLEQAAVGLTFLTGAVAIGFLHEFGKDLYRGVRAAIYHLCRAAKANAHYPSFHAFALNLTVDEVPVTFRIPDDTLTEEAFTGALEAARIIIALDMAGQDLIPLHDGSTGYFLEWDSSINAWRSMRRQLEGSGVSPRSQGSR